MKHNKWYNTSAEEYQIQLLPLTYLDVKKQKQAKDDFQHANIQKKYKKSTHKTYWT